MFKLDVVNDANDWLIANVWTVESPTKAKRKGLAIFASGAVKTAWSTGVAGEWRFPSTRSGAGALLKATHSKMPEDSDFESIIADIKAGSSALISASAMRIVYADGMAQRARLLGQKQPRAKLTGTLNFKEVSIDVASALSNGISKRVVGNLIASGVCSLSNP